MSEKTTVRPFPEKANSFQLFYPFAKAPKGKEGEPIVLTAPTPDARDEWFRAFQVNIASLGAEGHLRPPSLPSSSKKTGSG